MMRQMAGGQAGDHETRMAEDRGEPDNDSLRSPKDFTPRRSTSPTVQPGATRTATEEPDGPGAAEDGVRQAPTEEDADRSRNATELALNRTVAGALGALVLASLGLATPLGISPWLKTSLQIVGVIALAVVLVLSLLEWRAARQSAVVVVGRWSRRRTVTTAAVIGVMFVVIGFAVRHGRDDVSAGKSEVPFDRTIGTGPYSVNGTCWNHTCVLYERRHPSTASEKIARLPEGRKLTIVCQTEGATVQTPAGSSNIWDRLYDRRSGPYISDYFTTTPAVGGFTNSIARCPSAGRSARDSQVRRGHVR